MCCKDNRRNGGICYHKCSRKDSTHRHNKGGILIEFAFSIPILISLLFFINDHYRFHELKDKVKSSAYLAASMIQQINNNKSDKQLTKSDMGRIAFASCLNLFHNLTMFRPYPLGIFFLARFYYVRRIDGNNYQYQHCYVTTGRGGSVTMDAMNSWFDATVIKNQNEIKSIHPNLICNRDGDERLLIKCWYDNPSQNIYPYNKSKLGLFLLNAKFGENGNFSHTLVISPKPGLFPGKNE